MKKATVVLIVALAALLTAQLILSVGVSIGIFMLFCSSRHIEQSDIVGTYVGHYEVFPKITARSRAGIYKGGTHSLELKADQTYKYVYKPVDGNSVETSGLWELGEGVRGSQVVTFSDFLLAPSAANTNKPGYHGFPVHKRFFGPIRLGNGFDVGYYWVKRKKRNNVGDKK